jgi:hypothetical protein
VATPTEFSRWWIIDERTLDRAESYPARLRSDSQSLRSHLSFGFAVSSGSTQLRRRRFVRGLRERRLRGPNLLFFLRRADSTAGLLDGHRPLGVNALEVRVRNGVAPGRHQQQEQKHRLHRRDPRRFVVHRGFSSAFWLTAAWRPDQD